MKVLITGAAGFVGRHLFAHYMNRGIEPYAIDPVWGSQSKIEFFVENNHREDRDFDIVYHCGAFVGGRKGIDGKPAYLHTYNTMLDSMMFTWALSAKPKRFVYFSSSAAYPARYQGKAFLGLDPLKEDDIDFDCLEPPETTYGLSKLHGEQMAQSVSAEVPVTVLRPFSGYGEDQASDYPFPMFIARAHAHEDPFTVWGDGQQIRDWIHISDFVTAAAIAAEEGIDGPVNLCTGIGTTFDDLAALCMDTAGYQGSVRHLDQGPGNGVDFRVGDPTLMHQIYVPKMSLAEGVELALRGR